jgi:hypothetical protein
MPGIGSIIGGALAVPAGMIGTPSSSTTNGTTTTSGSSTSNPILSSSAQDFLNKLTSYYTNYIQQSPDLSGYYAQQANGINNNAQLADRYTQEQLAARGLSTSPVAASITNTNNLNRVNQLNTVQQQLPLLQRQLTGEALGQGAGFFSQIPRGQTNQMNQSQTTNQTTKSSSGGGLGGLLSGLSGFASLFG